MQFNKNQTSRQIHQRKQKKAAISHPSFPSLSQRLLAAKCFTKSPPNVMKSTSKQINSHICLKSIGVNNVKLLTETNDTQSYNFVFVLRLALAKSSSLSQFLVSANVFRHDPHGWCPGPNCCAVFSSMTGRDV